MQNQTPTAPSGFVYFKPLYEQRLEMPEWMQFLLANLIALLPFSLGLLLLWVPYQLYLAMGTPFALMPDLQLAPFTSIVSGILIFIASMLLHEWLHGLALQAMGYKPVYYFKIGVLFAGLQKGDYLSRVHYLIMTLTPLVVMSVTGFGVLLLLPPVYGRLLLIALLLNTAASLGDLFVAVGVYRAPKTAVFTDDNGIQVFVPAAE
ncbi:MAG: DUF3267 domain-containing protein [Chloroflexi bacterium]|nr:MAG: DUF3267 domain-containing protein [Chloroflexota bacterium]